MRIEAIGSPAEYRRFFDEVYGQDPCYKDNKSALLPMVWGGKAAFGRNCVQQAVAVRRGGKTLCQALLLRHMAWPQAMQLAFFEALPEAQQAVEQLVEYARGEAKKQGCTQLVAGLDGHCSYSVGFLRSGFGSPPCFGQSYNPAYYHDYFRAMGWQEIGLVSQWEEIARVNTRVFAAARRLGRGNITFEHGRFGRGFEETMARYTDLSNAIFENHRYCFVRQHREDYELFAPMRPLLRGDNLIFAKDGERTVGFLFWYPDFNAFVKPGAGAGVGTFARYRLLGRQPPALKVVEIGVLPQYRKTGLILQLFGELARCAARGYPRIKRVVSSWILEENDDSRRMSQKILRNPYKEFSAYETGV